MMTSTKTIALITFSLKYNGDRRAAHAPLRNGRCSFADFFNPAYGCFGVQSRSLGDVSSISTRLGRFCLVPRQLFTNAAIAASRVGSSMSCVAGASECCGGGHAFGMPLGGVVPGLPLALPTQPMAHVA